MHGSPTVLQMGPPRSYFFFVLIIIFFPWFKSEEGGGLDQKKVEAVDRFDRHILHHP
jgi:hypothetical protein